MSKRTRNTLAAAVVGLAAIGGGTAGAATLAAETPTPQAKTKIVLEGALYVTPNGTWHCYEDEDAKQSICDPV